MTKKYDLIIIGAGPAGAMAAKTAGENGLSVALLERRTDMEKITRPCSEGLLCNKYKNGEYVTFNERDSRIVYPYNGLSVAYSGPFRKVYKFDQYSADGHTMEMKLYPDESGEGECSMPQHIAIDKEQLINGLVNEARSNSVDIFPGVNVTGAENTSDGVVVTGNGEPYNATYALAADGLNSCLSRRLGFNKERKFLGTLRVKGWRMRGLTVPDPDRHIHIVEGVDAPPLFCICPQARKDEYYLSIGAWNTPADFDTRLSQVMKNSIFSSWFKNAKIIKENCCVLNMYTPITDPFKDNVLLIGDAAAFGQISTHNAILCGWKAAHTITVSRINRTFGKEGVAEYLSWWQKNFYNNTFKLPPVELTDTMTRDEVNYYFSLFSDPLPAFSGYAEMQRIFGEAMAKMMPQLQAHRPEIVSKIQKLREVSPEETWSERNQSGFSSR